MVVAVDNGDDRPVLKLQDDPRGESASDSATRVFDRDWYMWSNLHRDHIATMCDHENQRPGPDVYPGNRICGLQEAAGENFVVLSSRSPCQAPGHRCRRMFSPKNQM